MMRWSLAGGIAGLGLHFGVLSSPVIAQQWTGNIKQPQQASTTQALNLSEHLSRIGARFYGAWTCPACVRQMELFGKQAAVLVPYVECRMPEQRPKEAAACREAEVRAYPTWLLPSGQRREGVQSISELSRWSGLD
jgi:hypothetical protein